MIKINFLILDFIHIKSFHLILFFYIIIINIYINIGSGHPKYVGEPI